MKKHSDSVMNSPLRTPTGGGFGSSGEDTSGANLSVERPGHAAEESGEGEFRFRCADVADKNCKWETRGKSENDLMPRIEKHGREAHQLNNIDDSMRQRIRSNIRRAA